MTPPSDDAVFNTEAIKLLLQVAWADDVLEPAERAHILKLGRQWKVPEAELAVLMDHLDRGKPLPQPNMTLLRTKPDAVLAAAEALIAADGTIGPEEREFIVQVEQLLGRA